jgi:uncharacterized protein DUF4190
VVTLPARHYNVWAIVSICFACSTVIGSWCFGGLIAVITGHVARHQIKQTGEAGGSLALAGLIAGYVAIGLTLAFFTVYVLFFVFMIAFAATHPTPSPTPSPGV